MVEVIMGVTVGIYEEANEERERERERGKEGFSCSCGVWGQEIAKESPRVCFGVCVRTKDMLVVGTKLTGISLLCWSSLWHQ